MQPQDIISPIDLKNPADAQQWANEANLKRPWRAEVFSFYAAEIQQHAPHRQVLELGAGPGDLARNLLQNCPDIHYTAFDFSAAMHALAKSKLISSALERSRFVLGDFKQAGWEKSLVAEGGMDGYDAVIIHQALHKLRHKRHAAAFHQAVRRLLKSGAAYWVCDHLYAPHAMQNNELYMSADEHLQALRQAGFKEVAALMEINGLCVFKCNG